MTVTVDQIRAVPKVLLHDHLDGGLRPATIIELARAIGYEDLPSYDVEGLTRAMTGAAVLEGFRQGSERHGIVVRGLLTAMRTTARSLEIAELAVRYRDLGVVGFDIAGAEAGWPPSRHLDAFEYVQRENFHITIHAGEGFGLPSIWEAVQFCGAERLGHGVRIVDDIKTEPDGSATLGRLASFIRDRRIALERLRADLGDPGRAAGHGAAAFRRGGIGDSGWTRC